MTPPIHWLIHTTCDRQRFLSQPSSECSRCWLVRCDAPDLLPEEEPAGGRKGKGIQSWVWNNIFLYSTKAFAMHWFLCQEERQFLIVRRGKYQGFISSVKLPPRTDEQARQRLPSLVGYLIGFLLLSFCFFLLRTAVWGISLGSLSFTGRPKRELMESKLQ